MGTNESVAWLRNRGYTERLTDDPADRNSESDGELWLGVDEPSFTVTAHTTVDLNDE